jgi:tetratricopeptide (TPR) repeat protein
MTQSEELLQRARRCHEEGRYGVAADLLLEAFRAEPERVEVLRELGRLLRAVGDPRGAVDYLTRAWHIEPGDGYTVAELVLALHELGRPEEAVRVMLAALDSGLPQQAFADCLFERG